MLFQHILGDLSLISFAYLNMVMTYFFSKYLSVVVSRLESCHRVLLRNGNEVMPIVVRGLGVVIAGY